MELAIRAIVPTITQHALDSAVDRQVLTRTKGELPKTTAEYDPLDSLIPATVVVRSNKQLWGKR